MRELNGMKRMKRIILEYSSILLFKSNNGENEKSIPLFESLSGGNGMEWVGGITRSSLFL